MTSFKENVVFRGIKRHPQSNLNACVGNNGGPYDLFDYSKGYFEATRLLLADVQSERGILIDLIVYPVCLNFRHAIELYIKYLITDLAKAIKSSEKFKANHSLEENWKVALRLIEKSRLNPHKEELASVESTIAAIVEVDPKGEIFRYPESIKGDQHLKDWSLISLLVLEEKCKAFYKIAEKWHYKLDALLDR